jgi:hypothetical protein
MDDTPSFSVSWHPRYKHILAIRLAGFWSIQTFHEFDEAIWKCHAGNPVTPYDIISDMTQRPLQSREVHEAMMQQGEEMKRRRPMRRTAIIMGAAGDSALNRMQVSNAISRVVRASKEFATEAEGLDWLVQQAALEDEGKAGIP